MLLHKNKSNKRAISEVVSYVLLISMALTLSGMIYFWLKNTASFEPNEKCDENIALIVKNYSCSYNAETNTITLDVVLKNQGLFIIEGYLMRVSSSDSAKIADITLNKTGERLEPYQESDSSYSVGVSNSQITLIDLQPFQYKNKAKVLCSLQSQKITNCKF